jgi:hypothetical protein
MEAEAKLYSGVDRHLQPDADTFLGDSSQLHSHIWPNSRWNQSNVHADAPKGWTAESTAHVM